MNTPDLASPLELFFSWQPLLLAATVSGLTQSIKAGLEVYLGAKRGTGTRSSGRELRQQNPLLNNAVLPAVPIVLGAVLAAVFPVHPAALAQYAATQGARAFLVYALWGATVGQFSDYLYQRAKRLLTAGTPAGGSVPPPAPSEEKPVEPAPAAERPAEPTPPQDPPGDQVG